MLRRILFALMVGSAAALPEETGPDSCTLDQKGCSQSSGLVQTRRSSKKSAVEESEGTVMLNTDADQDEEDVDFDADGQTNKIPFAPNGPPPMPKTWAEWSLFLTDSSCEMKDASKVGGYNLYGTYKEVSAEKCRMRAMRKRHRYSAYGTVGGMPICYSFPVCVPSTAVSMPGVSVHRLQLKLWDWSATCRVEDESLGAWASESIGGALTLSVEDLEGVCQELADRQGHKFYKYQYQSGMCYSSKACTSTEGDTVREQPVPRHPTVACKTEEKIKAVVERHIFDKMPFSNRTFVDGRRIRPSLVASWVDKPMPSVVRDIFHDARDWNRLAVPSANGWRPLEEGVDVHGDYGGIDGCVYERTYTDYLFKQGLHGSGHWPDCVWGSATGDCEDWRPHAGQENWNLQTESENQDVMRIARPAYSFAVNACNELCCDASSPLDDEEKIKLCGAATCDNADSEVGDMCVVDMTVFGALRVIKRHHGPEITMTWGRRQGDCRNILKDVALPSSGASQPRIGLDEPHMAMFHNTAGIWKGFERLGFSKEETVALMGAHSIGKNNKYPGGPDTRNRGHGFCGDRTKLDPPLGPEKFDAASGVGSCKPFRRCYTIHQDGQIDAACSRHILKVRRRDPGHPCWDAGGGFWDHTPGELDNDYFRMLSTTNSDDKNACCGPWHDTATVRACQAESGPMQYTNGTDIVGKGCAVDWCMYSRGEGALGGGPPKFQEKSNIMMVSTKAYVGRSRLYRYAADWMLIEDPVMKAEVDRFARDEGAFHRAFANVFTKLINKGWSDADMKTCSS